MSERVLCYALLGWIGAIQSKNICHYMMHRLTSFRVKEKLRSGELAIPGDQWPVFLYHGYVYDPEDPWNGLFRSTLLVSVGSCLHVFLTPDSNRDPRHTNMYSHLPALSKRSLRPPGLAMHASMG
jgi:hypothetical protein